MNIPGIIFLVVQDGAGAGLLLLLVSMLVTLFTIFVINAVYILILRITTPNRFRTIISYFQIVFAITIYAGYQVFPRLMGQYNMENFSFTPHSRIIYFPFYWFASTWQLLYSFHGNATGIITALLGILLPVLSLFVVVKYLAPSFNNRLAMINSSGGDTVSSKTVSRNKNRFRYTDILAKIFTRTPPEKMGFLFTWKMMARSRDFKLKVYPGIGYMLVYIFIMFFRKGFDLSDFSEETTKGKVVVISALYITSFILTMAINQVIYSEKYKASWFYYTTPILRPGDIILGSIKAAIFKFYFPLLTVIVIASTSLIGIRVIPNLILGLFNELLIATLLVYAGHRLLPFSTAQSTNVKSGSFIRSMFVFFFSGMIAVGHFFIYSLMPVVLIGAVLSIIATWLMMTGIRETSWERVKSRYAEE
jgi:ABC-2 type transport system permease protein